MTDDTLYEQICENIRSTDEISFKLLGLVPVISGASIVVAVLKGEVIKTPGIYLLSIFGALVTLGLFWWELRNISTCKFLRTRAAAIEASTNDATNGGKQYLSNWGSPTLFGNKARIGKTQAEKFVYSITVIAWLLLPWLGANPPVTIVFDPSALNMSSIFHWAFLVLIAVFLTASLRVETDLSSSHIGGVSIAAQPTDKDA